MALRELLVSPCLFISSSDPCSTICALREGEGISTDRSRSLQIRLTRVVLLVYDLPPFVGLFDRTEEFFGTRVAY